MTATVAAPVPVRDQPARTPWSLRSRVTRATALVLVLLMVLVAVVSLALVSVKKRGDEVLNRWDPATTVNQRLLTDLVNQETGLRGYVLARKASFLEPYTQSQISERADRDQLARYLAGHDDLLALLKQVETEIDAWHTSVSEPLIDRVRSGDRSPGASDLATSKSVFDQLRAASGRLTAALAVQRSEAAASRNRAFNLVWLSVAVGVAVLLTAGALVSLGLRRSILTPIGDLVDQTRRVASGHLDMRIDQSGPAEIRNLGLDVDTMRARLADELLRVERSRLRLQERSAELARSNADLEQFAYVASHDLSEPLRKVTNFCQLLERQYADQLDDKAKQYIAFVVDGAKRMQILINDLLAFSRVGRTTDHFAPVDLNATIARARSTLEDPIARAGAELVVDGVLPTVPGDPTLLTALLQNLVSNAVKYHRPDVPPRVEISAERSGEDWTIRVSDNGIGIDQKYADRIFAIFQRLHLRDQYGGTGIGLALCRKIVEFHKGRIWLEQQDGPGSTFAFTLPTRQPTTDRVDDDEPQTRDHA